MKRYLNNSLFYQGDTNIFLSLCIVYLFAFISMLISAKLYFSWEIKSYLYNEMESKFIITNGDVVLLITFIVIVYVMTTGGFKVKKWSTLLSAPFSRLDIRKRELLILIISIIIYIFMFLIVVLKTYIQYYDIFVYIKDFYKIVILDLIRIISISTITIGVLAILDSIFSNIYYLIGAGVITFIYLSFLLINFDLFLWFYLHERVYDLNYIFNGLAEYISGKSIGNDITTLQIISMSCVFIFIGIILIFISKILTNKMFVENMNEGIMFSFPKKVAQFMIMTFGGIVTAPFISDFINEVYFNYTLREHNLVVIRAIIIIIMSIISYYVFRNFKKVKKNVYY